MVSGMYEDDKDADGGQKFVYTGEGGNDMLGGKHQIADQKLTKVKPSAPGVSWTLRVRSFGIRSG